MKSDDDKLFLYNFHLWYLFYLPLIYLVRCFVSKYPSILKVVIGVGRKINKTQLMDIAGEEKNLYTADSYEDLVGEKFLSTATKAVCSQMTSG